MPGFFFTDYYNFYWIQGIDSHINIKAPGKKMIDSVCQWLKECSYQAALSLGYRRIPVISPGLIQFRKGFWVGL